MIAPATPFPGRPCSGFVIRPSVKQQTRMTPKELSSRQVSPERAQLSQLVFHPFSLPRRYVFGMHYYRRNIAFLLLFHPFSVLSLIKEYSPREYKTAIT
ncbi:hypothetical protein CDAR_120591 [Caerostris darwini]|uniref:Uncharacterized protein n=1 Tax=Caerostris darwini TaxID=1538125 RepID=A0AAV4S2I3_9ARAC|nr:hypothetical protein CDAR_120591 [Caerostris darwini]